MTKVSFFLRYQKFERITISMPIDLFNRIEEIKKELKISKSKVLKIAFEKFLQDHKKQKLKKIAEMMSKKYETDKKLTEFTALDSEDFR